MATEAKKAPRIMVNFIFSTRIKCCARSRRSAQDSSMQGFRELVLEGLKLADQLAMKCLWRYARNDRGSARSEAGFENERECTNVRLAMSQRKGKTGMGCW